MKFGFFVRSSWAVAIAVSLVAATTAPLHVGRNPGDVVMVSTGQQLDPAGRRVTFDGRPSSLALSPNGRILAVANTDSLDLIDPISGARAEFPYKGANGKKGTVEAAEGLAFSPDGSMVAVSTNQYNVERFDVRTRTWLTPIVFPARAMTAAPSADDDDAKTVGPLPMGLAFSPDGSTIDVALDAENILARVNAKTGAVETRSVTGVAPVTVARGGALVAVLNWGGAEPSARDATAISGYTGQRVVVDPLTGIPPAGSVSLYDAATLAHRRDILVGRHPIASLFIDATTLLVAEANDDAIATIDVQRGTVVRQALHLPGSEGLGLAPQAFAYDRAARRLYVALAGANAVGVYDARDPRALHFVGALATDWYPGALALLPSGTLAVANLKGVGTLGTQSNDPPADEDVPICSADIGPAPRLGSQLTPGRPLGERDDHAFRGSIDLIDGATLAHADVDTTKRAVELARPASNDASGLPIVHHVLYVIKENKTYDQVLGDVPQGNGDPALVSFGNHITPNVHALASDFVLLDNFYGVGVQSGDGHQWTDEADATDYVERSFPDWARSYPNLGTDPLAYAASGFIWQNALAHGLSVRDYGEFTPTSFVPANAKWLDFWHKRARFSVHTNIPTLRHIVDPNYPGFTRVVPDQVRADEFLRELARFERTGTMPQLMVMSLPDDHTEGFKPDFPTPCAMAADNDRALGRIVDGLSHSRFWQDTLVLVSEDDSQDGYDHVDGHRTVGLMIGPMIRRHAVVSQLYTQLSMIHTAEAVLALPPMNRFDGLAPVMSAAFTHRLDNSPYAALPERIPLDQMNAPVTKLSGLARKLAIDAARWDVNNPDREPAGEMKNSIWLATRGASRPRVLTHR